MLSSNALVSIYIGDFRPLPTEVLLIIFEIAGLVGRGHRSMHFWVFCERPITSALRLAALSRRRRR